MSKRAKWELIILASMYLGYMAFILCRTAIQALAPEMLADETLGLNKGLFGQILAWGTAGMVLGKLANGVIADRLGGRRVFLLALLATALVTIAFGTLRSFSAFALFNLAMLFAAAAGWPAMASVISAWYPPNKLGKVWGIISTASRLSSVLSMLLFGLLIGHLTWMQIFFVSGGLGVAAVILISFTLKARPKDVGLSETETSAPPNHSATTTVFEALGLFFCSSRFWLMCVSLMATTVLMEFIGFIPIYLTESFGVSSADAARATSVFPTGCLVALVGGGFIYDRVSRKGRIALLGGMLLITTVCISLLWALPSLDLSTDKKLAISVVTLFAFGLTVAPAYYLPMSVFSVEFGGAHCGLLIGLIDAIGYFASMIYQFTGGGLVDRSGWGAMLVLLFLTSLIALMTTVWFAYEDFRHHRAKLSI